jgi:hypothetical protein
MDSSHQTVPVEQTVPGETPYELSAIYEFRPLPSFFSGSVRRYAGGEWVDDDGEYDIAFIGKTRGWTPLCLYFDPAHQKNIVASWTTGHWSARESRHPRGNPWHYALRHGTKDWGGIWDRERHPNVLAGNAGMSKMSSECGCCNGRGVNPRDMSDPHISARLVRDVETKHILVPPSAAVCMYCGDVRAAIGEQP